MANRLPLTANKDKKRIEELPAGEYLDLSQSGIVSAVSIQAQTFYGNLVGTAQTATYLENAGNILNGTINPSRLSGLYNINISGYSDFLSRAENIIDGYINPARLFGTYNIDITGAATSITVQNNTDNSNYYLTFVPSTGNQSVYIDANTSLIYNPSTNRLGINTSNPTSNLHIIGDARISGIVTASSFVGDGSGLTNLPGGGGASLDANDNFIVGNGSTLGNNNIIIGENAGQSIEPGGYLVSDNNILLGVSAGSSITTGSRNIYIGQKAGAGATDSIFNIFIGAYSGYYTKNTQGDVLSSNDNTFIGTFSGLYNTLGYRNVFLGGCSGIDNTTGNYNSFLGSGAGDSNTTGSHNSFFGANSGDANTVGLFNSFFGLNSGVLNKTGCYNSYFGANTGISTSASLKVILGQGLTGDPFDSPDINKDKQFAVGLNTTGTSEYWLVGNENFNVGIGTTNPTSKLHVLGNARISGIVTASSFVGDGSGLTNLASASLSRSVVSGATTAINSNGIGNTNIIGSRSYGVIKVGLSTAGWLRLYSDSASRDNDISRSIGIDPIPGSGVILEVVTTGISTSQIITPYAMGSNLDEPSQPIIYASVTNLSGITTSIIINLTILKMEL